MTTKMTMKTTNSSRKDLFAVKSRQNRSDPWCYVFITKDRFQAGNRLAFERQSVTRLGFMGEAKLVHPAQHIVNVYVAAGNVL